MAKLVGWRPVPAAAYALSATEPAATQSVNGTKALQALGLMIGIMVGVSLIQNKRQTGKWLELR